MSVRDGIHQHEMSRRVPDWIVYTMIAAVSLLFGFALSPFGSNEQSESRPSTLQQAPIFETEAAANLLQMTPSITRVPSATATRYPTEVPPPTTIPSTAVPWCSTRTKKMEICQHSGSVPPTPTTQLCSVATQTPSTKAYLCAND